MEALKNSLRIDADACQVHDIFYILFRGGDYTPYILVLQFDLHILLFISARGRTSGVTEGVRIEDRGGGFRESSGRGWRCTLDR